MTYWVGEAMQGQDFKDLPQTPDKVQQTTRSMARNALHLAGLLRDAQYPGSA